MQPELTYEFGRFRLEVSNYLLTRNGQPVSLQPKVFELLVILVQQHGHTIEKERLMQALWPDISVEENSLTQLVFQLRRSLGESAATQQFIETIPKRGYRFVADVRSISDAGDQILTPRASTQGVIDQEKELDPQSLTKREPVRTRARLARFASSNVLLLIAGAGAGVLILLALGLILWPSNSKTEKSRIPFQNANYRKLTASGKAIFPAMSPDGKLAAYVVDDAGRQAIWVRQIASTSRVQITQPVERFIFGLTFAPDGQSLYFVEKGKNLAGSVYQIQVFGGTARKVLDDVDSPISFSPDGKQFAFIRGNLIAAETALMIASVDGTAIHTLASRKRPDFFTRYAVAWSPDGAAIACGVGRSDSHNSYRQVITVNVADGKEIPVGDNSWTDLGEVAWLRDGTGIIVNAMPRNSPVFAFQLWHLEYPSGSAQKLMRELVNYEGLSIASHSDVVALGRHDRVSKIWVASTDNISDAQQILSSMSDNYSESFGLSWTSGGKLIYSSHGSGNSDIWIMDADGRNQKQLTFDSEREHWPVVSPDDRYIVFTSNGPSGVHLWRIDLDGANRKQLTFGKGESFPTFSPDGQSIFFSSMEPGWPVIGRISVDGGATTWLSNARSGRPVVSPDGKAVACLYFDGALGRLVVALIPVGGGEPLKLFKELTLPDWSLLQWTPDGRGLAYITTKDGVSNIWVQQIDGGAPRQLTRFTHDRIYRFAWSGDGKHIAIDRGTDVRDILLLTEQ